MGFEVLRTFPANPAPLRLSEDCRLRGGGPMGFADGESADCGLPSRVGEASKHSAGVMRTEWFASRPPPNLKGGQSVCIAFSVTADVVRPLLRDKDGRSNECLRRLQ